MGVVTSNTEADTGDWSTRPLTAGVVGAGAMGRGIAQVLAVAGVDVLLTDARAEAAEEALTFVHQMVGRLAEKGRLDPAEAAAATQRVRVIGNQSANLAHCDLVVEAVVEDLEVKRRLFAGLEGALRPDAVLATNTSSLSVTAIAAALEHPDRFCGLHFFNPVPLMRLVEVVPGERTDPRVADRLTDLVRRLGHTPVRVTDTPGFLVNHAGRAFATEALRIVDEGIAAPVDVDRVLREVAGFPMGPFELMDLTGLDVSQPVMETVYRGFFEDPRLRPSPTGRRRLDARRLGRKTGEGFYAYAEGTPSARPPEEPPPTYDGTPVWVHDGEPQPGTGRPDPPGGRGARNRTSRSGAERIGSGAALRSRLSAAGVAVEEGPAPSEAAVVLVTPWGADVTTTAGAAGLPAERTLGVDPFGDLAARLTLATNPATTAVAARSAHGALGATGTSVTVVRDGPGFLAQRVVAAVVNLGCEIAQLGLAAPEDIDTAVRLGLGYPRGPLEWGDLIGAGRVVRTLAGLHETYRDPRYRPSVWLTRRAALGLSLRHEEHPPR